MKDVELGSGMIADGFGERPTVEGRVREGLSALKKVDMAEEWSRVDTAMWSDCAGKMEPRSMKIRESWSCVDRNA